jgi:membrane protein YdbS with pleckstrin-like domain
MAVIVAAAVLFVISSDLTIFNAALDPLILAFYAFAWLGVVGAVFTLWVAAQLWRNRVGSRWSRIHHTLMAAGSVMLAWFFLTFHLAGTTLNY